MKTAHWDTIGYPVCGTGTAESPINIDTTTVVRLHSAPLTVDYSTSELTVENTGHVAEVMIPAGFTDTIRIGNDTYQLTQCHFHAPGEHEVNGRLADVEGHFVHQNSHGDTAVVAVLFRRGTQPNPLLDKILLSPPVTAGEEVTVGEANPARLFPGGFRKSKLDVGSFYTYNGSLTTPGCSEGVRWFVLADGGHVSQAAVRRFHYVISRFPNYGGYDNNNRPVLPLNGRVVGFRCAA